jgi:hypothetical protein
MARSKILASRVTRSHRRAGYAIVIRLKIGEYMKKRSLVFIIAFLLVSCSPMKGEDLVSRTALTAIAEQQPEVWHYVAFGDSTVILPGTGMMVNYKAMLEEYL